MKPIPLYLFILATLALSACEDHSHSHGEAVITFLSPSDNEQIPVSQSSNVNIHIQFEWTGGEGEAIEVLLVALNQTNDVLIEFENHQHATSLEFEQAVNLSSYQAGTEFQVTAKACQDHDCVDSKASSIRFTLVP